MWPVHWPQNLSGKLPARYHRLHRLLETLQLAREDHTYLRVLKQLAVPMYFSSTIGSYMALAAHNCVI